MLAADFAARLRARGHVIRQRGPWHDTTCPGHDDQRASLTFRDGDRGIVVLCRAGCAVAQISAALGVLASAFIVPEKENGRHVSLTVEALASAKLLPVEFLQSLGVEQDGDAVRIIYRLMDGSLAPRQRRRTALRAKDGSSWYPGEGSPVPYGLWRLSGALAARKLVIVEGETDCWTAWHEGVPTLGFPGADTVKLLQAKHLHGFEVVYILREPDRGGDTFVRGATRRLQELGWCGMVRILTMPDGLKDLSDLRCKDPGRFAERFEAALAVAVPFDGATTTATDTQREHTGPRSPWAAAQPARSLSTLRTRNRTSWSRVYWRPGPSLKPLVPVASGRLT